MNATEANEFDGLLAFGVPFKNNCKHVLNLSSNCNLNEAASNFFAMLQELDNTNVKNICVMKIPNTGIGVAINDKLEKNISNFL
jgi:L-threonylcarbamoyladenylate synthase